MCYLVLTTWILFTLTAELVACAHGGVNAAYVFTFFLARKEIYWRIMLNLYKSLFFYYIIKKKENETPGSFKALT